MSTRSVTIHDLSVEDLRRLRALRKSCPRPDKHSDLEVLRAGLDAMEEALAPVPEPVTLDADFEVLEEPEAADVETLD